MTKSARQVKHESVDIDGLDNVFEAEYEPIEDDFNRVPDLPVNGATHGDRNYAGISLKAAAIHYKQGVSTLRLKIKRGEIPARKIDGANGPEWRIFPNQINVSSPNEHGIKQGINRVIASPQSEREGDLNRLLDLVEKQSLKLEAAAGQIGYYKSQVESYQDQVSLLPDLQAQSAKAVVLEARSQELEVELKQLKDTLWYRLWCWFNPR
jgi:hypothetical protein